MIYLSDLSASSDDTVKLPGFVRVDAGIFAQIDKTWKLQLNVENLFDKGYWASARQQQHLARRTADVPPDSDCQVLGRDHLGLKEFLSALLPAKARDAVLFGSGPRFFSGAGLAIRELKSSETNKTASCLELLKSTILAFFCVLTTWHYC